MTFQHLIEHLARSAFECKQFANNEPATAYKLKKFSCTQKKALNLCKTH